jgi:hypothetical protein
MPFIQELQGKLQNQTLLSYEAELLLGWRNGIGLPCDFYQLPADVAMTMIEMQNAAIESGLW